jgi:D-inositol-3-phosphate glycosyltransferase
MTGAQDTELKIAYLSDFDASDPTLYSGGNAAMLRALRAQGNGVTVISQSWGLAEPLRRAVLGAPEGLSIRARWRLHLALARVIARRANAELAQARYDVLFCAYSFHSLSRLSLPYPMVTAFSSDATPTIYKASQVGQSYGSWFAPSRLLDPAIERAERRVFSGLDLALWPSDWLTGAVNTRYGLDPARSRTIPWGANIADPGPGTPAPAIRPGHPVEILLVGRDWEAKGGVITAETVALLRARGVDARLTVIGCTPPDTISRKALTVRPYLDKSNPAELAVLQTAFRDAHFLLMPSFESYGFAFCEASAYGLPSLCLDAGGVPVWNGENGHALPIGATAGDFAALVQRYIDNPAAHAALCQKARRVYEQKLNWDAWGRAATRAMHRAVNARCRAEPR